MLRTTMPVTPIDEHGNASSSKNDVSAPAKTVEGCEADSEPQATTVEFRPKRQLGLGRSRSIALHDRPNVRRGGPRAFR